MMESAGGNYTLIGQTYFRPAELRFHEFVLADNQRITFHFYEATNVAAVSTANHHHHHPVDR